MNTLEFTFEDLPIFTDLGFGFAPINGEAEISYDRDGSWMITDIVLEGFKIPHSGRVEHKSSSLCRKSYPWLFSQIIDSIETRLSSSIDDKVRDAIEGARTTRHNLIRHSVREVA